MATPSITPSDNCRLITVTTWMVAVAITTLVIGVLAYHTVLDMQGINTTPLFVVSGLFFAGSISIVGRMIWKSKNSQPPS